MIYVNGTNRLIRGRTKPDLLPQLSPLRTIGMRRSFGTQPPPRKTRNEGETGQDHPGS
jgi:hypothetical protein